jgi:hypothetical protein
LRWKRAALRRARLRKSKSVVQSTNMKGYALSCPNF